MKAILLSLLWLCCGASFGNREETVTGPVMDCKYESFIAKGSFENLRREPKSETCTARALKIESMEHCCHDPEKACWVKNKGTCLPNWLVSKNYTECDFLLPGICDPEKECGCCIECDANICSDCYHDETANCRKTCLHNEYSIEKKCHNGYCQCCKPCNESQECEAVGGHCVGDPSFCTECGFSASPEGCPGDSCYCCRPECDANICSACSHDETANCRKTCWQNEYSIEKECHNGFCQCCKTCEASQECLTAGGHCVGDPSFCTHCGFDASPEGCSGDGCFCCRPEEPPAIKRENCRV